jgi:hypothetical protein
MAPPEERMDCFVASLLAMTVVSAKWLLISQSVLPLRLMFN